MKISSQDLIHTPNFAINEASSNNDYSISEKKNTITIIFKRPEIIYKDEFIADVIASNLTRGKTVEINCGKSGRKSEFIASELISRDILNKLYKQDGYLFSYGVEEKKIRPKLFSSPEKFIFVIFEKYIEVEEEIPNTKTTEKEEYIEFNEYAESDFKNQQSSFSWYQPANLKESNYGCRTELLQDYELGDIAYSKFLIATGATIQYLNDSWPDIESPGLLVEKGSNENEIFIDVNGREEFDFSVLLTNLVVSFLKDKNVVVVDWGECKVDDLEDKLSYDPIYSPIKELASHIEIDDKSLSGRPHTFATFKP